MKRAGKKHLQLFSSPPPLSLSLSPFFLLLFVPFFGDPLGGAQAPKPPPLGCAAGCDGVTRAWKAERNTNFLKHFLKHKDTPSSAKLESCRL